MSTADVPIALNVPIKTFGIDENWVSKTTFAWCVYEQDQIAGLDPLIPGSIMIIAVRPIDWKKCAEYDGEYLADKQGNRMELGKDWIRAVVTKTKSPQEMSLGLGHSVSCFRLLYAHPTMATLHAVWR